MITEGHTNNQMAQVFNTGTSAIEKQHDSSLSIRRRISSRVALSH